MTVAGVDVIAVAMTAPQGDLVGIRQVFHFAGRQTVRSTQLGRCDRVRLRCLARSTVDRPNFARVGYFRGGLDRQVTGSKGRLLALGVEWQGDCADFRARKTRNQQR